MSSSDARQASGQWLLTEYSDAGATVSLSSLQIELRIADIYEKVDFREVSNVRSMAARSPSLSRPIRAFVIAISTPYQHVGWFIPR